jgi:hypothetical protein
MIEGVYPLVFKASGYAVAIKKSKLTGSQTQGLLAGEHANIAPHAFCLQLIRADNDNRTACQPAHSGGGMCLVYTAQTAVYQWAASILKAAQQLAEFFIIF